MSKRVLVVDDDQAIRDLLQEVLIDEAYEVDTAHDGLKAWEKLTRHPGSYQVILLDVRMPRLDGLQLFQIVQKQQQALVPSIILLSSDNESIHQALNMGVCHALEKPFDLAVFLELVATVKANVLASQSRTVCPDTTN